MPFSQQNCSVISIVNIRTTCIGVLTHPCVWITSTCVLSKNGTGNPGDILKKEIGTRRDGCGDSEVSKCYLS